MNVILQSAGHFIPDKILTNKDLYERFKTGFNLEKWIIEKTGISERRISDLLPSELGTLAAKEAMIGEQHKIDFIIVNTYYGDYTCPQTATLIQSKLGLNDAFAFEINMPCAGPIYSISIAHALIKCGKYKRGLLIGVDKVDGLMNPEDFFTNSLFGDGAGALLVSESGKATKKGVIDFYLGSSSEGLNENDFSIKVLAGKAKYPIHNYKKEEDTKHYFQMDGKKVKNFVREKLKESVDWLVSKHVGDISEVDYVITHQANKVVVDKCLYELGVPKHKILSTTEYLGNTSSASIFITISKHFNAFKEKNKKFLICGIGGGLTWGGIYYRT